MESKSVEKSKSIKDELKEYQLQLNEMDPVASIVVARFPMSRKSEIAMVINEEYKRFGHQVDRQHFGVVLLSFNQINKALEYLSTDAEYFAFYAVPYVIKRGIIVNYQENHKGRQIESITFAAPVEINNTRGNMGVVVQRIKGTSRYKTHRIIMPDGTDFVFKEIKSTEPSPGVSLA
ncbi:MAG: hypothetical protein II489_07275 [Bacteroidaceae bacterium]|nr:hypothetical protein [Bacteroidaceae bacterium]